MGDNRSTKKKSGEMENLALDSNRFSRDLLQRFMGAGAGAAGGGGGDGSETADDGELELNLGLSLGGRFGVDKSSNKLLRSSSIAACLPIVRDDDAVAPPAAAAYSALVRTSSLPVETEEEWRKRKELQTIRRLEAKRRRSEKQRISRGDSAGAGAVEEPKRESGVSFRTRLDKEQLLLATKSSFRSGIDIGMFKGKRSCFSSNKLQPSSQGSIESQGANSSSISELESKSLQGNFFLLSTIYLFTSLIYCSNAVLLTYCAAISTHL